MICPACKTEQSAFTSGFGYAMLCLNCYWQLAEKQEQPIIITVPIPKGIPLDKIVVKFTRED